MGSIRICGAAVLEPSGLKKKELWIRDGVFVQPDPKETPDETIDAAGLVAAPGLVDLHVHLRDPGQTEKEDLVSGCRAAAAGGVTSLLAMPNTRPAMDSPEVLRAFLSRAAQQKIHVYQASAATKGLFSENCCDLAAMQAAGARAVSDDGFPVKTTDCMRRTLLEAARLGLPVFAHCEDPALMGGKMNAGALAEALGVPGMPEAAEENGIARDLALAEELQVPLHLCHVSTRGSVALIRKAKARGVRVTAETAPHYFSLDESLLSKRDADYRMNPPLRTKADVLAVIEGLCDGTLDAIATDHAPHAPAEKADFLGAPNGSIGMETSLAAGLTFLVEPGHLTLAELLEKMSRNPARILGIPAGTLSPGAPADLVLFDPKARNTVDPARFHGKSRNCPFKGMTLSGRVRMTSAGGTVVYRPTL